MMKPNHQHLGEFVRERLRELGLPAYVVCRKYGISANTLRLLCEYDVLPSRRDVLERIAKAIGVDPRVLLDWEQQGGEG